MKIILKLVAIARTIIFIVFEILFTFVYIIKTPFTLLSTTERILVQPASLTDPKYGVHKYIKANSIKLHYVESGDPSKALMLFLHGFPEFWYSWRHQIVYFNKNYRCVAVDMRGYGNSEKPEGISQYKIEILVNDIVDLIHQLGYKNCIIIAHDWSGLVACELRKTHPEVLQALVALSSTSLNAFIRQLRTTIDQIRKSFYVLLFLIPILPEIYMQLNNLRILDKIFVSKNKDSITEQDIKCYKYCFRKPMSFTPPINYYRANFRLTWSDIFVNGNIPFLLAHGDEEKYFNNSILKAMEKEYSNIETVILKGSGHFMNQEAPEEVNKLIKNFLIKHNL